MSLTERLRSAEVHGREAVSLGFQRTLTSLEDAQSQLRRKMRIHPRSSKAPLPLYVSMQERENPGKAPEPIVTINGEDQPPETETGKEEGQVA